MGRPDLILGMPLLAASLFFHAQARAGGPVETGADWRVHRDEEAGFEIRCPDDWLVSVSSGPMKVSLRGGRRLEFVVMKGKNPKGLPVEQWLDEERRNNLRRWTKRMTLGGRPAVREGAGSRFQVFAALNETDIFAVRVQSLWVPGDRIDLLCEDILATLKFTDAPRGPAAASPADGGEAAGKPSLITDASLFKKIKPGMSIGQVRALLGVERIRDGSAIAWCGAGGTVLKLSEKYWSSDVIGVPGGAKAWFESGGEVFPLADGGGTGVGKPAGEGWTGVSYSGGGFETFFSYPEHPLEHYQTQAPPVDRLAVHGSVTRSHSWRCGEVQGRPVYEVFNEMATYKMASSIKMVLIETRPGLFRPLYLLHDSSDMIRLNPSVSGDRILIPAQPRYGPSVQTDEREILVDVKRGVVSRCDELLR